MQIPAIVVCVAAGIYKMKRQKLQNKNDIYTFPSSFKVTESKSEDEHRPRHHSHRITESSVLKKVLRQYYVLDLIVY